MDNTVRADIWQCMHRLTKLVEVSMGVHYSNEESYRSEFEILWRRMELIEDVKNALRNIAVPEEEMLLMKERDDDALNWSQGELDTMIEKYDIICQKYLDLKNQDKDPTRKAMYQRLIDSFTYYRSPYINIREYVLPQRLQNLINKR